MFAIGTRPDYRLPFTTVVVDQIAFNHTHRDDAGFTWQEPITLNIHLAGDGRRSHPTRQQRQREGRLTLDIDLGRELINLPGGPRRAQSIFTHHRG
jgi:hypothetical protein